LAAGNATVGNNLASSLRYFHHDHQGSTIAVTNEAGVVIERMAFDPWGKRRNINGLVDASDSINGLTTDRGYTGHEHLDEMGIIHMNGRVYDPLIGRFMSADPFIQAPDMLQSYNRYAYVMNNPLNLTDPSGYWSFRSIFRAVAVIAITYFTAGAATSYFAAQGAFTLTATGFSLSAGASIATGAIAGFVGGVVSTGTLRGGVQGALTGALFGAAGLAGGSGEIGANSAARYAAHAAAGCISSVAGGGSCGSGAASSLLGKFTTNMIGDSSIISGDLARGVATTIVGGIGSMIAGGKFENGAVTAAFGYLFNELQNGRGTLRQRLQSAGYAETSYSDGSYCNIQGGNGSCGHAGAVSNDQTQAGASGGFTAAALLGASMDVGPVKSTDGSCAVMRNVCVIGGPIFGATIDTTLLNVSAGSPSDGWSISFINKAAIPVGGYSIAPGYGSDGLTLQAGRSFGTMLGWGVKACIQKWSHKFEQFYKWKLRV
jgi:RHS repeat-associated protein